MGGAKKKKKTGTEKVLVGTRLLFQQIPMVLSDKHVLNARPNFPESKRICTAVVVISTGGIVIFCSIVIQSNRALIDRASIIQPHIRSS